MSVTQVVEHIKCFAVVHPKNKTEPSSECKYPQIPSTIFVYMGKYFKHAWFCYFGY